jgi:epoxyqueuosine reductase
MSSDSGKAPITARLQEAAGELGFVLAGSCAAVTPVGITRFREWLERGFAGEMRYLPDRAAAYEHPQSILDGVRSLLMLALPYATDAPHPTGPGQGRISRYAWGSGDYHDVIHDKLKSLAKTARDLVPNVQVRGVTDTAPLLERDFAQLAGLGWIGKNTMLINRKAGSWFFLAALLLDCELDYDAPHESDHCGTCTACLDACPTSAFPEPYVLDATRCISYLTIELRGSISEHLRPRMGEWLFGCDVCQEVCPWNGKASRTTEHAFTPAADNDPVDLLSLFDLTEQQFRDRFRRTPLWRTRRRGILRNAALALGNRPTDSAVDALQRGLHDIEPLVRGATAWSLGRIATPAAHDALRQRLEIEADRDVIAEIEAALRASRATVCWDDVPNRRPPPSIQD